VLYVTLPESGGPTSACSSWSLLKEFAVELVDTACSRFSRGWVARLSNGCFALFRVGHCLSKTGLLALYTRTRR
jgi:hypothetical protein